MRLGFVGFSLDLPALLQRLRRPRRIRDGFVWVAIVLACASWMPVRAQPTGPDADPALAQREAAGQALQRASDASIGVIVHAVEDAPSVETLGQVREGSGVVIGADGLVLTVGYLILEAEQIDLVLDDGRVIPAHGVAFDLATGFGLVQSLIPLPVPAAPLGSSAAVGPDETLLVVSGGSAGAVSPAKLLARGRFAGYWEYLIEDALFTAPARPDHSGAGLYNGQGELIGIGLLVLADARSNVRQPGAWLQPDAGEGRLPGNLFVPVDLLKPILGELRRHGRSLASHRAWLGLNCVESEGAVTVLRVSRDSPAEAAGMRAGDRILRLDGVAVDDLAGFYQRLWQGGDPQREVRLEIVRDGRTEELKLDAVDRQDTIRQARGI